jgi:hypothetical protein
MQRSKSMDEFLGTFCPEPPKPHNGGVIYRGTVHNVNMCADSFTVDAKLPEGFEEIGEFQDGHYRIVWRSDAHRAVVTYCEGDVNVTIDRTVEAYQSRLAAAAVFYKTH